MDDISHLEITLRLNNKMNSFDGKNELKTLLKYIAPEKRLIFKFGASLLISSGSALSFPIAMVIPN